MTQSRSVLHLFLILVDGRRKSVPLIEGKPRGVQKTKRTETTDAAPVAPIIPILLVFSKLVLMLRNQDATGSTWPPARLSVDFTLMAVFVGEWVLRNPHRIWHRRRQNLLLWADMKIAGSFAPSIRPIQDLQLPDMPGPRGFDTDGDGSDRRWRIKVTEHPF